MIRQRAPLAAASGARRPPITGVSHIAVYAADPAKTERFYVHDLGGVKGDDPENAQGRRYYFAPTQFVEVLAAARRSAFDQPARSRRLHDHRRGGAAHVSGSAEDRRAQTRSSSGSDGSRWFDVRDPEGNRIEFVQPPATVPDVPLNPLSNHIIHVGFIVHDRAREDGFFRTVLGFKPYWFGGMKDDMPTWISQQVPDGTDWLEYMIVGTPDGRGIPPTMSAADLGVLDHFSLGVPARQTAYTLLWNGDRLDWPGEHAEDRARCQVAAQPDRSGRHARRDHGTARHRHALLLALHGLRSAATECQRPCETRMNLRYPLALGVIVLLGGARLPAADLHLTTSTISRRRV